MTVRGALFSIDTSMKSYSVTFFCRDWGTPKENERERERERERESERERERERESERFAYFFQ